MQQQILDLQVPRRNDFETFIPCASTITALEFARRCADPDDPEKLLYLYGPAGSGKTHLLHSIGRKVMGDSYTVFSCCEMQPEDADELLEKMSGLPALLIDDIDRLADSGTLRAMLWEAFNQQHTAGRTLALAGRHGPRELHNLDDHLTSRLLWGLVASLELSDDRSRLILISKLAHDRQILLPDDVAAWLLTVLPRDAEALISAADQLYRAALSGGRKITLRLARELFHNQQPQKQKSLVHEGT